jgi:hypothetical protein
MHEAAGQGWRNYSRGGYRTNLTYNSSERLIAGRTGPSLWPLSEDIRLADATSLKAFLILQELLSYIILV